MPLLAERRHQAVFGLATGRGEGLMHAFGQRRAEKGIVFDIDPKHRHTRCAAEFAGRFHQSVRCAIVVWLAADTAATAGGKGDDGLDLWWVQAGKRDRGPSAGGLPDADDILRHDALFGGHVVDDTEINLCNRKAGSAEIGVAALSDFCEERAIETMLG